MRASITCAGALLLLLTGPVVAAAQDDTARARALFAEGLEFADHEQWQQAAERFRATLRLRASPAVAYNLAASLEKLGQLGEASRLLDTVMAAPGLDRNLRRTARRLQQSIRPRIGHVTIRLESDLAGATVRMDDAEVGADRIGQSLAADPGDHTFVLLRHGRAIERRQVSLTAGASETVTLGHAESAVPTPEQTAQRSVEVDERPPVLDSEQDSEGGGLLTRWWFWTAVVVVVAAGVVGGVLLANGGTPDPVQGDLMPGVIGVTVQ